ncbi:MAG TPA: MerR family transcriptional regulator [Candidatus Babeliales bacterium]|nr:MerR family transcriptional regulator [Candidatus Babeliales bacterium]
MSNKKNYLSISAVAKMFTVHQQTIRFYEKEGLIKPKRSAGNTRLFTETDIQRLEEIIYYTHQLGINLSGVELILKLKAQIERLQATMNRAFVETQTQLNLEVENSKRTIEHSAKQLVHLKKSQKQKTVDSNPWDMKYDEQ